MCKSQSIPDTINIIAVLPRRISKDSVPLPSCCCYRCKSCSCSEKPSDPTLFILTDAYKSDTCSEKTSDPESLLMQTKVTCSEKTGDPESLLMQTKVTCSEKTGDPESLLMQTKVMCSEKTSDPNPC